MDINIDEIVAFCKTFMAMNIYQDFMTLKDNKFINPLVLSMELKLINRADFVEVH